MLYLFYAYTFKKLNQPYEVSATPIAYIDDDLALFVHTHGF